MKAILTLFISTILFSRLCTAQDAEFSQFFSSPLHLNPAHAGFHYGRVRAAMHFKRQNFGIGAMSYSAHAAVDWKIKITDGSVWACAVKTAFTKMSSGLLNSGQTDLVIAYHKKFDRENRNSLGLAFELGFAQAKIDPRGLYFNTQFARDRFDPSLYSGENFPNTRDGRWDLGTGLLFKHDGAKIHWYAGASLRHINSMPVKSPRLLSGYDPLATFTGGIAGNISVRTGFYSSVLFQAQTSTVRYAAGGALKQQLSEDKSQALFAGCWLTNASLMPYVAFQVSGWQLGFSTDVWRQSININNQRTASFEMSLVKTIY